MNLYDALIYKKLYGGGEIPQNAYLLQTKEHESIATFTDGTDNFFASTGEIELLQYWGEVS